MAKKPTKTRAKALTVSILPPAVIPGTNVVPEAAYRNDRHPIRPGPWKNEPDKFAWTDPTSGFPCVVVRGYAGEYSAHVGVPPDHSLSGYKAKAGPGEISEGLHRPVSCAEPCQRNAPEPVSICHITARIAHGQPRSGVDLLQCCVPNIANRPASTHQASGMIQSRNSRIASSSILSGSSIS